jgi:hypothetical protein
MDATQPPTCLRCGTPPVPVGERQIQTLGILERYIEVVMLQCPQCRHVEFFQDPQFD